MSRVSAHRRIGARRRRARRLLAIVGLLVPTAPGPARAADELFVGDGSWQGGRVVHLDGTAAGPPLSGVGYASWSRDGGQLIVRTQGGIDVMGADGSNRRTVASMWTVATPVFSPDATRYAVLAGQQNSELRIGTVAGGAPTPAYQNFQMNQLLLDWSSQDELAVVLNQGYDMPSTDVSVIRPDGTGRRTVLSVPHSASGGHFATLDFVTGIAFSPDGKTLAVTREKLTNLAQGRTDFEYHITTVAVHPGGINTDRVLGTGYSDAQGLHGTQGQGLVRGAISFAPDGHRIAAVDSTQGSVYRVGVYDVRTGSYSLTGIAPPVWNVRWRPQATPIVFVHGFLGSRILCGAGEAWPNIPPAPKLLAMRLGADGFSSRCAVASRDEPGLVKSISLGGVTLSDVYGSTVDFLRRVAPGSYHVYSWDWRRSPERALADLDRLVDRVRSSPGGKVVLMAHSMGGLVTRWYIDDPQRAAKVARAVTIGTPYWGSAKALFPLAAGVETPGFSPLDAFFDNRELQSFARNLQGLYFLWPTARYGGWLTDVGRGARPLAGAGLLAYTNSVLGGNGNLLASAWAAHAQRLDTLRTNGVDYQIVVGTGLPTIERVRVAPLLGRARALYDIDWQNGDGTVPRNSARLGGTVPASRLHYVCGVGHVPLPGDPGVTGRIQGFLLDGKPIDDTGSGNDCAASGFQFRTYSLALGPSGASAPGALTLDRAQARGLIERLDLGAQQIFATSARTPVRLRLPARTGLIVTPLGGRAKRRPTYYRPARRALVIEAGRTAVLRSGARALRPLSRGDRTPPRTTVRLRLGRTRVTLRLSARDRSGVAVTFVKIGARPARRAARRLAIRRRDLRKLRYQSIDVFGNAERPRSIALPRRRR